ncbi:MAG TPA: VOC family protein [Roseiarcus sp.]|nr:VOC family protein [Roseiarcus sp.]
MDDPYHRSVFTPALFYKDPFAALDWLERAFGFERSMVLTDSSGALGHAELRFADGTIYIGGEWSDFTASPGSVGGRNTQVVHVRVLDDIDGHCERARSAGAVILAEPQEQFYGDRTYRARDPEGHNWTFAQPVRAVSREEAEKASGLNITGWA